jgi:hypothetical protein
MKRSREGKLLARVAEVSTLRRANEIGPKTPLSGLKSCFRSHIPPHSHQGEREKNEYLYDVPTRIKVIEIANK